MTSTRPMPMLKEGAVVPQLHQLLRDRIINCDLEPGQRLSETEFAKVYDVSRQPVREAFIKLANEKLVIVRPQRGTFVRLISVPDTLTSRFVREAVEVDLIRRVVDRATPEIVAELEAQIELQREVAETGTPAEFMRLDEAFHRRLAEVAGKLEISEYLLALNLQINRVRNISARLFEPDKLVVQHAAIVTAIRAEDATMAEGEMREHLRKVKEDLPHIILANPDYFEGAEILL